MQKMGTGLIAAVLVATTVTSGCQAPPTPSAPAGPPSSSPSPSNGAQASSGSEPSAGAEASGGPTTVGPTSESLIADALTAGTISLEESLLYRALALFDSPGLPEAFRSDLPDLDAATALFGEIALREPNLSPDVLRKLAPYRVRPADPSSIFNGVQARSGATAVLAAATVPTWRTLRAAGGAARVWVKDSPNAATQLSQHAGEVATVWAKFPGLLTYPDADQPGDPDPSLNPDAAIDFYFVDASDLDPRRPACVMDPSLPSCVFTGAAYGYAQRAPAYHGVSSSGYLVIDAIASRADLLDTIAHELAHAAQFAYDQFETSWLMESTATCVAYRVLKKLGLAPDYEYGYLRQFFGQLDQPLVREANHSAYASWLFFLFASMEEGDAIMATIWEVAAAEGVQGEKAVDQVFSFDEHFDDFAVRNWNRDPVERRYKTADEAFPRGHQPQVRNVAKVLEGGKEDSLNVTLPPLASAYYEYVFQDSVRDVTLENTLAGLPDAHVWAITNVHEDWKRPEDWTDRARPSFCRDIAEEDLVQLVLVVSNTSMTRTLTVPEPPRVVAGTKGCGGWRGTMTSTETWNVTEGHGTATSTLDGLWTADDVGDALCPPDPARGCVVFRPSGKIAWTWDSHHTNGPCDETNGGTVDSGHELHPDTQVLYLRSVDPGHVEYWGLGSYRLASPELLCSNPLTSSHWPPRFFEILPGSSGWNKADTSGNSCYQTTWQIETTADTITGSCFAYQNDHTSLEFEWNLRRVGGAPGG